MTGYVCMLTKLAALLIFAYSLMQLFPMAPVAEEPLLQAATTESQLLLATDCGPDGTYVDELCCIGFNRHC